MHVKPRNILLVVLAVISAVILVVALFGTYSTMWRYLTVVVLIQWLRVIAGPSKMKR